MSFVLLKQLSTNDEQRDEMLKAKALQAACRAVKSDKPEVSEQPHNKLADSAALQPADKPGLSATWSGRAAVGVQR